MSVIFDAAYRRMTESVQELWIAEGTIGFVLFMVGIACFGSAIRYLVHMDRIAEYADRKARHRARSGDGRSRSGRVRKNETGDEITLKRVGSGVL